MGVRMRTSFRIISNLLKWIKLERRTDPDSDYPLVDTSSNTHCSETIVSMISPFPQWVFPSITFFAMIRVVYRAGKIHWPSTLQYEYLQFRSESDGIWNGEMHTGMMSWLCSALRSIISIYNTSECDMIVSKFFAADLYNGRWRKSSFKAKWSSSQNVRLSGLMIIKIIFMGFEMFYLGITFNS